MARPDSFDDTVLSQLPRIRAIGRGLLPQAADVGDFVQDVIVRVYLKRGQLRDEDRLPQWIAAIASNAALGDAPSIDELVNIIARGKGLNAEVGASALRRLPPELAHRLSLELFALDLRPDPGARLLESWRRIEWDASEVYAWGLANQNIDVRMQTLWLVGQRQERGMLEKLAGFLGDKDPRIRGMAAWAIVRIAPEEYVPGTKV